MKRILLILCFIFVVLEAHSQIITVDTIHTDCNSSIGYIVISTDVPTPYYDWYVFDNSVSSWIQVGVGANLDSISLDSCGSYRVRVYDSGWNVSDEEICVVPCPMKTDVQSHQNIKCFGDSTGSLKHVVSGGTPFNPDGIPNSGDEYYNYTWYKNGILFSSGPNDTLLINLSTGQYVVNVTDLSSCVFQPVDSLTGLPDTSVIFQPSLLRIDPLVIDTVHCKGTNTGSVVVNIKDGKRFESGNYYDFYLTNSSSDTIRIIDRNGMSANVASDTTPYYVLFDSLGIGNYTIHVVDSFGCTLDSIIYVMEPDDYTLHVSINPNIICEQDSTWMKIDNISGGHPHLEYYWIINSLDSTYQRAGTYTSYIYDTIYGCIDYVDYTLTAPNTIYCDVTSTIAECFGTNTGSLQVDSIYGGVPPYSVQWGGIDTNNLFAGQYTLFITDSLGCIYMEDHEVLENPDINLNEIIYTPLCNGDANGSVVINISGGTSPLNYFWLNGTGGPDSLFSLPAGTYFLETIDALGCPFLDSVVVFEPEQIAFTFTNYDDSLLCRGAETTIDIAISGGTGPFSVLWDDGNTDLQRVLPAGIYSCEVSDINGCTTPNNQIIITEPDAFSIQSLVYNNATCNPNIGGDAIINTIGGTEPIQYIWNTGETSPSIDALWEVNYWVIATDSCGNSVSDTFDLISSDFIMVLIYDTATHTHSITIDTSIGGPFSYEWTDVLGNIISTDSVTPLCEGTYFVTTTNNTSNCSVTDTLSV